jgi:hypothetical protein
MFRIIKVIEDLNLISRYVLHYLMSHYCFIFNTYGEEYFSA